MAKWADFVITCATYTSDNSQISTVGVRADNGDNLGDRRIWHREQVVRGLAQGTSFVTATQNENGKWTKGAEVLSYTVSGEVFIKTVSNNKAEDNLGNLPSCA